jgi:CheY-like chemotaxis protein
MQSTDSDRATSLLHLRLELNRAYLAAQSSNSSSPLGDNPTSADSARAAPKAARRLRIIVADDDRDTVDMLAVILRDEGHIVHGVYSGKDVLPAVRMMNPDAVILDIAVPGLSGYACAQEIRYTFTEASRPFLIAISGMWKERSDQRLARQVGFDAHLLKPCAPDELIALLGSLQPKS